jgi:hypothetical protein
MGVRKALNSLEQLGVRATAIKLKNEYECVPFKIIVRILLIV